MPVEKLSEIELGPADLPLRLFAFMQNPNKKFEHACRTKEYQVSSCLESL